MKKSWQLTMVAAAFALGNGLVNAAPVMYTDRTAFESAVINEVTDDFDTSYGFINSAVTMRSLSAAGIGYESTFFSFGDLNIVSGGALCWGCNGSGKIILDATTVGTSNGVFGFGVDVTANEPSLAYDAFVTFGDGTTQNFDLGSGPTFFGLTSAALIKEISFGLPNGGTTNQGYFTLDNVTIGAAAVPAPGTLPLIGFALAGLAFSSVRRGRGGPAGSKRC